jgi:8-oxo-dGTP pyrophosphatase MutT (NUDIX family)
MKHSKYVGCFIVNSDKKILLQFRGPNWKTFPNSWCTFGGKVEENESVEEGLQRELKEEIDLDIDVQKLVLGYEIPFDEPQYNRFGSLYYYTYDISKEEVDNLKLLEGNGWGWFTFEEVMKLETAPNLKEALTQSFSE